jgi:hypothetical protein
LELIEEVDTQQNASQSEIKDTSSHEALKIKQEILQEDDEITKKEKRKIFISLLISLSMTQMLYMNIATFLPLFS